MSGVETAEEIPWLTTVNLTRPTALCETGRKDTHPTSLWGKKSKVCVEGGATFSSFWKSHRLSSFVNLLPEENTFGIWHYLA